MAHQGGHGDFTPPPHMPSPIHLSTGTLFKVLYNKLVNVSFSLSSVRFILTN
jgi:hypothetical protein